MLDCDWLDLPVSLPLPPGSRARLARTLARDVRFLASQGAFPLLYPCYPYYIPVLPTLLPLLTPPASLLLPLLHPYGYPFYTTTSHGTALRPQGSVLV